MAGSALRCCWRRLLCRGAPPAARSSHTVNSVAGRICVFGGEDRPRNAFDAFVHTLGADGAWSRAGAPLPGSPLLGHGAASLGPSLFVFGGREGGPNTFSGSAGESGALHVFDADAESWAELRPMCRPWPEPRSFHAMCAAGQPQQEGRIFVFGGCGAAGRLNDLWSYSPGEEAWECLHPGGTDAVAPVGRGGSSLVSNRDGTRLALMYGFSGKQCGDMAIFDVQRRQWQLLPQEQQKGDVPQPRSVFCTAVLGGDGPVRAVIFGGEQVASDLGHEGAGVFTGDLHALDLESLSWSALRAEGEAPEARGWTGMAARGPGKVLLFGGLNTRNERLGDAWELEFSN